MSASLGRHPAHRGHSQPEGSAELRRPLSGDFVAQGSQLTFEFDEERGGKQNALSKVSKSVLSSADERLQAQGLRKQTFANSMLQSVDVQTGVVFNEDSASKALFSTITSEKVKEKVTRILKDMHEHAESQQHTMRDEMDYQDILSTGILYEGEHLIDGLEPMRLMTLDMAKAEDVGFTSASDAKHAAQKETRYGIRLYLTNQRLIIVDAEPDRGSQMRHAPEPGRLTRNQYRLSYEIESELWYSAKCFSWSCHHFDSQTYLYLRQVLSDTTS
eukprot:COSAG04_NODE_850_length_9869_cov_13.527636_9_plen_273_part_00